MQVTIKLFATLREGRGKVLEKNYPDNTTIEDILIDLNINKAEVAILLKNGITAKLDDIPSDGEYLSIFPPVGGG